MIKYESSYEYNSDYDDITPDMTSNSTPAPYQVSSDGTDISSGRSPYKVYSKSLSDAYTSWHTSESAPKYNMLYFGKQTKVNAFSVTAYHDWYYPTKMTLYGSNDGTSFEEICSLDEPYKDALWDEVEGDQGNAGQRDTIYVYLNETISYSYYKLSIDSVTENSDGKYVTLWAIRYYYKLMPINKFTISKILEKNVPETIDQSESMDRIILTEQGNIYTYDIKGNKIKLGGNNEPDLVYTELTNEEIASLFED